MVSKIFPRNPNHRAPNHPCTISWNLGGGNSIFFFHPYLGKISILTNIFRWVETSNQKNWDYIYLGNLYRPFPPVGHPKWWWLYGNPPKNGLKSGWGFMPICQIIAQIYGMKKGKVKFLRLLFFSINDIFTTWMFALKACYFLKLSQRWAKTSRFSLLSWIHILGMKWIYEVDPPTIGIVISGGAWGRCK